MTRLTLAALTSAFLLTMLGIHSLAHAAVAEGPIAWLAVIGALMWLGVAIENRERVTDGRAPYSLTEAAELIRPGLALAAVLAAAWWLRH